MVPAVDLVGAEGERLLAAAGVDKGSGEPHKTKVATVSRDQVREIAQMKRYIARLEAHPTPDNAPDLPSYRDKQVPPPPPETDESVGINTLQPIR